MKIHIRIDMTCSEWALSACCELNTFSGQSQTYLEMGMTSLRKG